MRRVDRGERFGQAVEIAGMLQPAVPYALGRSGQHPPCGRVGFGDPVDRGGDLDADRLSGFPLVAGDLDAKGEVAHAAKIDDRDLAGSRANASSARIKKIRINILKLLNFVVAEQAITGRITGFGRRIGDCLGHRRG